MAIARLKFKHCGGSSDILTNLEQSRCVPDGTSLPEIRGGHVAWVAQE